MIKGWENKTWVTIMDHDIPLVRVGYGSPIIETVPVGPKHLLVPQCFYDGTATLEDWTKFVESRCVPRTRMNIDEILEKYGLISYNAFAMIRLNHGRSMTDYIWIKFDGEDIDYERDIKLRD